MHSRLDIGLGFTDSLKDAQPEPVKFLVQARRYELHVPRFSLTIASSPYGLRDLLAFGVDRGIYLLFPHGMME